MKRFVSLLLTVILVCGILGGCGGESPSPSGNGSGEAAGAPASGGLKQNADGFYEIYTAADFVAFREIVEAQMLANKSDPNGEGNTASACLMADIDLSTVCSETLGSWRPIGFNAVTITMNDGSTKSSSRWWRGTLEGNGHTISGLYVDDSENHAGLFYEIYGAEIRNLVFKDCYLRAGINAGTVAAAIYDSVISNVTIESNVTVSGTETSANIGGVVGFAERKYADHALELNGCVNKGTVTGYFAVGGIVGRIKDTTFASMGERYDVETEVLIDCENQGTASEAEWSGGLVGQVYS